MGRPSKNRHGIARAVFASSILAAGAARADAPRLVADPDVERCPAASELRQAIASRLGRDDFDKPDAPDVVVRVRRIANGGVSADVSMTHAGSTSTRTIEDADTCADLVRAAALTVALAIEREEKSPPETHEPAPPVVKPAPAPAEREVTSTSIRDDRIAATASAITALGLLPRPAVGAGAAARVRITRAAWLSARGFWLPEASMPNDAFALRLIAGGAGACVEPFDGGAVSLVGCGHVLGGAFDVTHANVSMKNAGAEAYVAASLLAGARARVHGPLHLEGAIDAHVPFTRPTYLTDACPPRGFEPPFVALALWFGAGISLR